MPQLTVDGIRSIVHDYMTEHSKKFGNTYWMKNKLAKSPMSMILWSSALIT